MQTMIMGRVLLIGQPVHHKLMERSDLYRHCIEALMQRWIRSYHRIDSASPLQITRC